MDKSLYISYIVFDKIDEIKMQQNETIIKSTKTNPDEKNPCEILEANLNSRI